MRGKKENRAWAYKVLALVLALGLALAGCGKQEGDPKLTPTPGVEAPDTISPEPTQVPEGNGEGEETTPGPAEEDTRVYSLVKVDDSKTYQVIESFGASGAWWSQYVGGWDKPYKDDPEATRDKIARLLYDPDTGIGLTSYRYNLGAGSNGSGGIFWDQYRRAESFMTPSGELDFTKDANAVWFLKKVVELGAEEIVLFCNSPLVSLTVNGLAHMTSAGTPNLLPENYGAFADYCFDVAEHFLSEGIPVKFISPINEPQWDWEGGQEGCHYETSEIIALLRVFVEKIQERDALIEAGVEISAPEGGEWGNKSIEYAQAIMKDEVLGAYFTSIDNHSYWSDKNSKKMFATRVLKDYPDLKLRASEWCEMVNGSDFTMDSAFNMLDVIYDDLTILNVVSWQFWVAVAPGGYRDGLIYVNQSAQACRAAKRLWAFGNLTKYVHPGYTRVEVSNSYSDIYDMRSLCFTGVNAAGQKEMVFVFINREDDTKEFRLGLSNYGDYQSYQIVTTSEERDLEVIEAGDYTEKTVITVEAESITTLVLTGK